MGLRDSRTRERALVVIDDFDLMGMAAFECEADPPLRVDPDAIAPRSLPRERLELIRGRESQIAYRRCRIQLPEPHRRPLTDFRRQASRAARSEESLGLGGSEGAN